MSATGRTTGSQTTEPAATESTAAIVSDASAVSALLDRLASDLGRCETSTLNSEGIRTVTGAARRLERATAALVLRLGQQANALAAKGRAAPAAESLGRDGQVSARQAREEAARARTADRIPALGEALKAGGTSAEHLDAVARALNGLNKAQQAAFLDQQDQIADQAQRLPVDTYNAHIRKLAQQAKGDGGLHTLQQQREASELKLWKSKDGMGHLKATLDPERFAALETAIQAETRSQAKHTGSTVGPNLQAAALIELVSHGNGRAGRAHLSLVIDEQTACTGPHANTVAETDSGIPLPLETVSRLACDAVIRNVRLNRDGVPIDVGRRYRTATDAQWAALKAIYKTCAWHNCDRPVTWCQAHHILPWEQGGASDLDNLIPLCSSHHHAVHEGKWSIKLHPDRTLSVQQPDHEHWATTVPDRWPRRPSDN